ncbi:MAG TPA: hypothetical protein VEK57_06245 [Thermoanaerobaculia bacterium]|nr:hypothetical protein [Thermoanaerobaculia bacterium]
MENRDRDRVSQRTEPTEAGKLNRETSEELGRRSNMDTTAEFGQSIGRSENFREGGEMRNRDKDDMSNSNMSNDSGRRSGSGSYGSSTGRTGSVGNMGGGGSEVCRDESNRTRDKDSCDRSRNSGDSSEGRH